MNLFTGLSTNEIISFFLSVGEFSTFALLAALSLYAFWVASRPVLGRVRTAAVWHFVALLWFMASIITAVWSAPAEKSFVASDTDTLLDFGRFFPLALDSPVARLQKVALGALFALVGLGCMAVGAGIGRGQKRRLLERAASLPLDAGTSVSAVRS